MAGQIRMTPEQLRNDAKRYGTSSAQIEAILTDLSNLQDKFRSEWEGKAFEQFDVQFEQLRPKVQQFSKLLEEIQGQLQTTANAVEQHDLELSRNFGLQ
ncbi:MULTISPECIES: WXG100 family type VII secretion target [unclassified Rummeliibacillus]|uniref:WXG100 family type VII secretion target n=1 Tax=unclassified Rummeliibacillus TaxID=2622809 RepID=UPI000E66A849|nr:MULTISPECIES: WXG100 family type VII secretion target [unclassified Rummeliibacillus]RIJ63141.1 WXG100 family type VII secretion target [Rummeliibacillus sp. POC4]RPJ94159.1 WXG100 family type VII secretion target [Rummeliibacillus sp. TYF005]